MRTTLTRGAVVVGLALLTACGPTAAPGTPTSPAPGPPWAPDAPSSGPSPAAPPDLVPTEVPVRPADLDAIVADAADAAVAPVGLALPELDIEVPVDPVGVQEDGQMEIPPRAERAGWYRFGPAPADGSGTVVVAAHVDSVASGVGPFARLHDATEGTLAVVTSADGTRHTYRVTEVRQVTKAEAEWAPVFTREGPSRLVLVTCGGTFQPDQRRYSDNVVVVAELVDG